MDINSISSDANLSYLTDKVQSKAQPVNFKNLFIFITNELKNISLQMADPSTKSITIKGITFADKNSTGALFFVQRYATELDNINSFASDIMAKINSFNDQASKMVGG